MNIIEQIIPSTNKNRPGGDYKKDYITIHETGNTSVGAGAKNHANYLSNGANGEVGYHYTVDDKEAYHHIPDNEKAWHAGDGATGTGNTRSIGIEICVNSDGDFEKAKSNAAYLVAKLMKDNGIPIANVVQHNHWSGKDCPHTIRKTGAWDAFKAMCQNEYDTLTGASSGGTSSSNTYTVVKGDSLSQIGAKLGIKWQDIASLNGITSPYTIYAGQVLKLPTGASSGTGTGKSYVKGTKLVLNGVKLYGSASTNMASRTISGSYYLYDGVAISGRMRITNSIGNVGKTPVANYVTGWIDRIDI